MEQQIVEELKQEISLLQAEIETLKAKGYEVASYSGYTFEQLLQREDARPLLDKLDLLLDGPFVESQKSIELRFRGSANQRVLDVPASLAANAPVWCEKYR